MRAYCNEMHNMRRCTIWGDCWTNKDKATSLKASGLQLSHPTYRAPSTLGHGVKILKKRCSNSVWRCFKQGKLTYLTLVDIILKSMVEDMFSGGLRDPEPQQDLKLLRPSSLEETSKRVGIRSSQTVSRGHIRIREVNLQDNNRSDDNTEETLASLTDTVTKLNNYIIIGTGTTRRPPRRYNQLGYSKRV